MSNQSNEPYSKDDEFSISREFNTPRKLIFEVFTDPKHLVHCWGPIKATPEERETFKKGFASMKGGFSGTFDQLAEYLATL